MVKLSARTGWLLHVASVGLNLFPSTGSERLDFRLTGSGSPYAFPVLSLYP